MKRVSIDFARWVNRIIAWVRRNATKVSDYKNPTKVIPNRFELMNTVYAFPGALKKINSGRHNYAIMVNIDDD